MRRDANLNGNPHAIRQHPIVREVVERHARKSWRHGLRKCGRCFEHCPREKRQHHCGGRGYRGLLAAVVEFGINWPMVGVPGFDESC